MHSLKDENIVIIGITPWDTDIGSNCKDIALEFAKKNKVIYINTPMNRKKWLNSIIKRASNSKSMLKSLTKVTNNLWVYQPTCTVESINWVKQNRIFDYFNYINNRRFAANIKEVLKKINFNSYLLFNDSHIFLGLYLKKLLKPSCYIYYIRDNLIETPYWSFHGKRLEPRLISSADTVVCNSLFYQDYAREFNSSSFMVGQGCDFRLLTNDDKLKNKDIVSVKYPIIGYVGYLTHERLDLDLLLILMEKRKDWNFVFIGPQDSVFKNHSIHRLKNFHYLGAKDQSIIGSYIRHCDILINPQKVNKLTIGNYPRKIDEYLAFGKPIVATKTKAMEYFGDTCYLATDHQDFIDLIEVALKEKNENLVKKRIKLALSHSWETSVSLISEAVTKCKLKELL